jgi:hypothetical protein
MDRWRNENFRIERILLGFGDDDAQASDNLR